MNETLTPKRLIHRPRLMPTALLAGVLAFAGSAFAQTAFDAPDTAYTGQVRLSSSARGTPLVAGGEVGVSGRGFKPGQKVTLLRGATVLTPEALVADGEGKVQGKFTLPADAAVGTHPIVVTTDAPYNAEVVDLKISPVVPLSGVETFKIDEAKLPAGLYQSAYSAKNDAVFVTATSGRPPKMKSELLKLDPASLKVVASVTPAEAPPSQGDGEEGEGAGEPKAGGVFAVYGIALDDANDTVWVTNTRQNTVAVYKQSDLSLVKQFEPGIASHSRDVAVDEKNGKAYVSPFGEPEIVVIDTKSLDVTKRIALKTEARGKVFSPIGLRMDPESGKLFVASMTTPEVAVIDTASDEVDRIVPLPGARGLMAVAYDAANDRLFAAGQGGDDLIIAEGKSGKVLHDVAIGAGPLSVAFEPVSGHAYVSSRDAGTVTVVDGEGKIVANLDQAPFPNHVFADGKGGVYSVNKSRQPDDEKGDRILHIRPAE